MTDPLSNDVTIEMLTTAEDLKLKGQYDEALALLEDILLHDPDNIAALEEVAENELNLNHFDRAAKAATRALLLDDKSYTGYYVMGFLASQKEDWVGALELLKTANKLKGSNPEILRCLGYSLFQNGDHIEGIVTLERALNLDADNTLILCDLGVAYLHMQNFEKAKLLFGRAVELEPTNSRAQECVEAVERIKKKMAVE